MKDEYMLEMEDWWRWALGHFRLFLCTNFYLDLKGNFVVSSFRWNMV